MHQGPGETCESISERDEACFGTGSVALRSAYACLPAHPKQKNSNQPAHHSYAPLIRQNIHPVSQHLHSSRFGFSQRSGIGRIDVGGGAYRADAGQVHTIEQHSTLASLCQKVPQALA